MWYFGNNSDKYGYGNFRDFNFSGEDLTEEMGDRLPIYEPNHGFKPRPWRKGSLFCKKASPSIRGCCNEAIQCFEQLRKPIEDLKRNPNKDVNEICSGYKDKLSKDRTCMHEKLVECGGQYDQISPTIRRKFDSRIDAINDQYERFCKQVVNGTTIATTPSVTVTTMKNHPTGRPPNWKPPTTRGTGPGAQQGGDRTTKPPPPPAGDAENTALIIGSVVGAVLFLTIVLIIAVIYLRRRIERVETGSSGGSMWSFNGFKKKLVKPPNTQSPQRRGSDVYAEINEGYMDPVFVVGDQHSNQSIDSSRLTNVTYLDKDQYIHGTTSGDNDYSEGYLVPVSSVSSKHNHLGVGHSEDYVQPDQTPEADQTEDYVQPDPCKDEKAQETTNRKLSSESVKGNAIQTNQKEENTIQSNQKEEKQPRSPEHTYDQLNPLNGEDKTGHAQTKEGSRSYDKIESNNKPKKPPVRKRATKPDTGATPPKPYDRLTPGVLHRSSDYDHCIAMREKRESSGVNIDKAQSETSLDERNSTVSAEEDPSRFASHTYFVLEAQNSVNM